MKVRNVRDERIRKKCIAIVLCMMLLAVMLIVAVNSNNNNENDGEYVAVEDAIRLLDYITEENYTQDFFENEKYVTVSQGREIYADFCGTTAIYPVKGKGDKKKLTEEEWLEIYRACVEKAGFSDRIYEADYTIISDLTEEDKGNVVYTDKGMVEYEGIDVSKEKYRNNAYLVYDKVIIYKIGEMNQETVLKNVWLDEYKDNTLKIYTMDGYITISDVKIEEEMSETIGDISFGQGKVQNIALKRDLIHGKILSITEEGIEIDGYGTLKFDEGFSIYRTYAELSVGGKRDLVVGYDLAEFVVGDGKICSALVRKTPDMQNIRVLIKSTGYSDIFHGGVIMEVTEDAIVKHGETEEIIAAGTILDLTPGHEWFKEGRIYIAPVNSTGRVKLNSVERACGTPAYPGIFELTNVGGKITIVNELLLEEYLYHVVPSEMPQNYGIEALKAQAVCARSYAYNQILYNGYAQYGAHVDDSVSYQVYYNIEQNEEATRAVKETCGEVAMYQNNVIDAYYYSTSCGVTTDAGIWESAEEKPYITSHTVNEDNVYLDLTSEEAFSSFIKNKSYPAYDSDVQWYRWVTRVSLEQIKRNIDNNMMNRYNANPKTILTKNEEGKYESIPIDTVGKVKSINITKRGKGGVATEMVIKGSKNTVKVLTEYNIRMFLAPVNTKLQRNDGTYVESLSLLPSAYTTALPVVDEEDKEIVVAYEMFGGGYGHGAGMSQNGAKGMASKGKTYEEILKFFYEGIDLKTLY
ncbi:MAG: SpoIID/LytB domain-containing protein [Lachnospiraceae bacterium]|nr:SpoIID/LytB domain-containing protein [Lachnospiraceae bacterium]